ncbi:hypothetical protein [Lacicoccus qingdaonensis]|uniref:YesK-like protein n=1 Tax=Lacicoccus qingdaonensis TaxID=576118 RepID=A0A1G9IM04_9BACL|nr:hypothetical protein [Salinicoccus qingdaonensis]SDL26319.1 hypothetical protein SAMN05216216_13514 [Salinicoccus qingdaonensis]
MFLAVILTIIALIYAINHRQEPIKTAYAGVSLLSAAIVCFILFFIIMMIGIRTLEPAGQIFFETTLSLIPVGSIIAVAGLIMHFAKSR